MGSELAARTCPKDSPRPPADITDHSDRQAHDSNGIAATLAGSTRPRDPEGMARAEAGGSQRSRTAGRTGNPGGRPARRPLQLATDPSAFQAPASTTDITGPLADRARAGADCSAGQLGARTEC